MATTKSRASRGADKADQDQPEREPLGAAGMRANEPEPAGPYAEVGAEEVHIPFYRPSVQVVAAGLTGPETIETITCERACLELSGLRIL